MAEATPAVAAAAGGAGAGESKADAGAGGMNDLFKSFPLSLFELPPGGNIIVIPSTASIAEAVHTLDKHKILAAPVRDVTCVKPNPQWHELYLGLFSMTDAVHAALKMEEVMTSKHMDVVAEDESKSGGAPEHLSLLRHTMFGNKYFATTPVTEALHTFGFGPFVPLEEDDDTTVLDAALILGKYKQHRVIVVQPSVGPRSEELTAELVADDRKLKNIITQSALVNFIARADVAPKIRAVTGQSIAKLGLGGSGGVVQVELGDTALTAFEKMAAEGVSAVAVTDSEGKIVGTVSNRDVRVLATTRNPMTILRGPVRSLISLAKRDTMDISHPTICAKAADSLELVIQRMAVSRIHRVFVVDDARRPIGVVSLTDVLELLVKEPHRDYFRGFFDLTVAASKTA